MLKSLKLCAKLEEEEYSSGAFCFFFPLVEYDSSLLLSTNEQLEGTILDPWVAISITKFISSYYYMESPYMDNSTLVHTLWPPSTLLLFGGLKPPLLSLECTLSYATSTSSSSVSILRTNFKFFTSSNKEFYLSSVHEDNGSSSH